tara:strand:- start:144 stop:287 length:144 start_codon:yes stop_codon:yes gene_type:complete
METVNMAKKQKAFTERSGSRKRPGVHKKTLNKSEKRSYKKYNKQGRK